jgi:hypothetical protein
LVNKKTLKETLQLTPGCIYELKKIVKIFVTHNLIILFRTVTTCFGLGDHHKAIFTIILIIMRSAVQIKLVSSENSSF